MSASGPARPTGSFGDHFLAGAAPPQPPVEADHLGSPKRVELFDKGVSIGWLGEGGGQWCVVANPGAAVSIRSLMSAEGVLYYVNAVDLSRYLSVSGTLDHRVGFYNNNGATGWTLSGDVLKSQYTNAQLSYWSRADGWVYANTSAGYKPLTVEFHDIRISHVFVLMLENHSFDNVFAFSGISGINVATANDVNEYNKATYPVGKPAPTAMPTDPGHEFLDVVEQLAGLSSKGENNRWRPGQEYPPITNVGYVSNYATTETEIVKPGAPRLPTPAERGDVMMCFDTPRQLPVIYQLATEFAICDQWFSSIPGPTWPNRFFVHGASSVNWDDSPSAEDIKAWDAKSVFGFGFTYPHGSIYDTLKASGIGYRIYQDRVGNIIGGFFPQVAALHGVDATKAYGFSRFADDLLGDYQCAYTFIEPNYGDISSGSYKGGSSQHPMDGMARGEALIKATYEALRASPLWDTSVLIITYDEHGGFYDSAKPPRATPPDDGGTIPDKQNGFKFDQYGVRVPAVVVSPLIAKGTVDHTLYDHTSVLATLQSLWNLAPLTQRDRNANDVLHLLVEASPRTDCPTTLPQPVPDAGGAASVDEWVEVAPADADGAMPIPDSGNVQGFLAILFKTDVELSDADEVAFELKRQRVLAITTRAEVEAYAREVMAKVEAAQSGSSSAPPLAP